MKTAAGYAFSALLDQVELARREVAAFQDRKRKAFDEWQNGRITEDEWFQADRRIHAESSMARSSLICANQNLANYVYDHRAEFLDCLR